VRSPGPPKPTIKLLAKGLSALTEALREHDATLGRSAAAARHCSSSLNVNGSVLAGIVDSAM